MYYFVNLLNMNVDKVITSSKVIANLTQYPMKMLAESVLLNELNLAAFRHLVSIPPFFGMQTSGGTLYAATSGSILPIIRAYLPRNFL